MTKNNMLQPLINANTDRRQSKRYIAKERTFAVIRSRSGDMAHIEKMSRAEIAIAVFKSKPVRMGQIIEIGNGGLSFSFIDSDAISDEATHMDILFADDNFYLGQIPFHTVTETRIDNELPFTPIIMKKRGIKFVNLTQNQKRQLAYFLTNHVTGEVLQKTGYQA